jgi:phosphohistidine swiveling domain-containing protein
MPEPTPGSPTTPRADPGFPVTWDVASDAELTWEHDDMHTPFCLAPLAWDYGHVVEQGFGYRYDRLGLGIQVRARVVNGYLYFCYLANGFDDAYVIKKREHAPLADAYWRRAVPELRSLYGWIADVPVDDLPAADLAEAWEGAWQRTERAWQIHFYAISGPYQVLDDLADFYEAVVPDATPGEALRLIQGRLDDLEDVDTRLGRLVDMAGASVEVRAALATEPVPAMDAIAALPGGVAFVTELEEFLRLHGHLGQGFDDLGLASWAEEPSRVLADVARRLEHPPEPADERSRRLTGEADALAADVRLRLAGDDERLAEFERLLALGREIGPLTEVHNYWIDRMAQARLRTFCMRTGARLAREGIFDQADDILYLRRAEVPALISAPADVRPHIAARRAEHAHFRTVVPPRVIGRPTSDEPGGRFDGVRFAKEDDAVVRGTGASVGIVTGPARVVLGPDDFERVQPGDILVAPSSNPSWVALFAIAGGLVTNTGGVLSHAAVVAREFGLPAVVGTGDATTRIVDGQMLELDGTTGFVRLR